jgi:hypothetical protein
MAWPHGGFGDLKIMRGILCKIKEQRQRNIVVFSFELKFHEFAEYQQLAKISK